MCGCSPRAFACCRSCKPAVGLARCLILLGASHVGHKRQNTRSQCTSYNYLPLLVRYKRRAVLPTNSYAMFTSSSMHCPPRTNFPQAKTRQSLVVKLPPLRPYACHTGVVIQWWRQLVRACCRHRPDHSWMRCTRPVHVRLIPLVALPSRFNTAVLLQPATTVVRNGGTVYDLVVMCRVNDVPRQRARGGLHDNEAGGHLRKHAVPRRRHELVRLHACPANNVPEACAWLFHVG